MTDLFPFPPQPDGVPWPTERWPEAAPPPAVVAAGLDARVDALIGPGTQPGIGHTNALAIVHRGQLVVERYGEREMGPLAELAGVEPGPIGPTDPLSSWSMAKSILHLVIGVAWAEGRLQLDDPAPVPAWQTPGDPRGAITWDHLLTMRPGLAWSEVYDGFDGQAVPDVVEMLYGSGAADVAAFAADVPLVHEPGSPEAYTYSSGTSNILARAVQDILRLDGWIMANWIRSSIFTPMGAASPDLKPDARGTWVASSYVDMNLRDWLRLGLLVLRGGAWERGPVVPSEWIDHGRTPRSPDEDLHHGAHWWTRPERDDGMFMAHGFEGQRLLLSPGRDLVLFRQGRTPADRIDLLNARLLEVVDLFPLLEDERAAPT